MQYSASLSTGSARIRPRPLSTITKWKSRGFAMPSEITGAASGGRMTLVYEVIG